MKASFYQKNSRKPHPFVTIAFSLVLLSAVPLVAAAPKEPEGKWMKELAGAEGIGFTGYPHSLGWQAKHPASYQAPFLIVGKRPTQDLPTKGVKIIGSKHSKTDWVIADDSDAVWVTGLLPPPKTRASSPDIGTIFEKGWGARPAGHSIPSRR